MKKGWIGLVFIVLMLSSFCGCAGQAGEGDCKCVVELTGMPDEFEMLDENIRENLRISVRLENLVTEKYVYAYLTQENEFAETLKLQPGTYVVEYVSVIPGALVDLEVEAKQERVELTKEQEATLEIAVVNGGTFTDWAWSMSPSRDIMQADVFSGMVQFEGKMIDLTQITSYVNFEYGEQIRAREKATFGNSEKGVYLTVQNQGDEATDWRNCKILEVSFRKNNVVFSKGVSLGMSASAITHQEKGLLGLPDVMSGTVLVGMGYADTNAGYLDEKTGNKLTLTITPNGDYISQISYAFEVFE